MPPLGARPSQAAVRANFPHALPYPPQLKRRQANEPSNDKRHQRAHDTQGPRFPRPRKQSAIHAAHESSSPPHAGGRRQGIRAHPEEAALIGSLPRCQGRGGPRRHPNAAPVAVVPRGRGDRYRNAQALRNAHRSLRIPRLLPTDGHQQFPGAL